MKRTIFLASAIVLLLPAAVAAQIENPEAGRKYNEGKALFQQGQYAEAEVLLRESAELEPGNYLAHYVLGLTYKALRRPDDAIAQYEAAVRFNPNYWDAYHAMAIIYQDFKNDPQAAIENYTRAGALSEQYQRPKWQSFYNMGVLHFQLEEWDNALQAFSKVAQYQPTNYNSMEMMGRIYVEKGDYENAMMRFQQASTLQPTRYTPHFYMANVLNRMGSYDQAIEAADRAIELMPGNGGALYEKGVALRGKQEWDAAITVLREAARDAQWRQMAEHQIEMIQNRDAYVDIPPDNDIPPAH